VLTAGEVADPAGVASPDMKVPLENERVRVQLHAVKVGEKALSLRVELGRTGSPG
jgi:hypothetical protein